jgi:hypothetical protein
VTWLARAGSHNSLMVRLAPNRNTSLSTAASSREYKPRTARQVLLRVLDYEIQNDAHADVLDVGIRPVRAALRSDGVCEVT